MSFENPSRDRIREILLDAKTIAVVGLSDNLDRTSYMVTKAMQDLGYRIIPVNPYANSSILGEKCYGSLTEIEVPIDIVNVFRRSETTVPVARDAVTVKAKVLWLQQGIINQETAKIAQQGGLEVIMDRCIKVEHAITVPRT